MRRFRLNTLLLLVVIAALVIALVVQHRREVELRARLAQSWPLFLDKQGTEEGIKRSKMELSLIQEDLKYLHQMLSIYNAKMAELRGEAKARPQAR
jgi:hypothetical protein